MKFFVYEDLDSDEYTQTPGTRARQVYTESMPGDIMELDTPEAEEEAMLAQLTHTHSLFTVEDPHTRTREAVSFAEVEMSHFLLTEMVAVELSNGQFFDTNAGILTPDNTIKAQYHMRAAVIQSSTTTVMRRLVTLMADDALGGDTLIIADTSNLPRWKALLHEQFCASDVRVVRRIPDGGIMGAPRVLVLAHNALVRIEQVPPGPYQRMVVGDAHAVQTCGRHMHVNTAFTWLVSDFLDIRLPSHADHVLNLMGIKNDSPPLLSQVRQLLVHQLMIKHERPPQIESIQGTQNSTVDLLGEGSIANTITSSSMSPVRKERRNVVATELFQEKATCSICYVMTVNCSTNCGHTFCSACVGRVSRCPTCRASPLRILNAVDEDKVPAKIEWLKMFTCAHRLSIVLVANNNMMAVRRWCVRVGIKATCMRSVSRINAGGVLSRPASRGVVIVGFSERACIDLTNVSAAVMMEVPSVYSSVYRWHTFMQKHRVPFIVAVSAGASEEKKAREIVPIQ